MKIITHFSFKEYIMKNIILEKTEAFGKKISRLNIYLTKEKHEFTRSNQILRSGTSIGANIANISISNSMRIEESSIAMATPIDSVINIVFLVIVPLDKSSTCLFSTCIAGSASTTTIPIIKPKESYLYETQFFHARLSRLQLDGNLFHGERFRSRRH